MEPNFVDTGGQAQNRFNFLQAAISMGPIMPSCWRATRISCNHVGMPVEIKTIGASGQISLGKQYAGRTVTVDQVAEGVWTIKTARVIPDDELWLHTPKMKEALDRALDWSESHSRSETDLGSISRKINRKR